MRACWSNHGSLKLISKSGDTNKELNDSSIQIIGQNSRRSRRKCSKRHDLAQETVPRRTWIELNFLDWLTHFFPPHDFDLQLPLHVLALLLVLFHLFFGLPHFLLEDIQDVGSLYGGHDEAKFGEKRIHTEKRKPKKWKHGVCLDSNLFQATKNSKRALSDHGVDFFLRISSFGQKLAIYLVLSLAPNWLTG